MRGVEKEGLVRAADEERLVMADKAEDEGRWEVAAWERLGGGDELEEVVMPEGWALQIWRDRCGRRRMWVWWEGWISEWWEGGEGWIGWVGSKFGEVGWEKGKCPGKVRKGIEWLARVRVAEVLRKVGEDWEREGGREG